jgi:ABC-type enterochelin transport system permease subunit
MTELIIVGIIAGAYIGSLVAVINEMMKKDNQIAELQSALVDAYTEIEFAKLGILK